MIKNLFKTNLEKMISDFNFDNITIKSDYNNVYSVAYNERLNYINNVTFGRFGSIIMSGSGHTYTMVYDNTIDPNFEKNVKNSMPIKVSSNLMRFLERIKNEYYYFDTYLFTIFTESIIGTSNSQNKNHKTILFDKLLLPLESLTESDDGHIISNYGKQSIKLGKLLSKTCKLLDIKITNEINTKIEVLVDSYKAWYKSLKKLKFVILEENNLLKGYSRENFVSKNSSMLNGSCMNDKLELLNLYTENPDKILMLSLQDESDNIYGRSLIWNVDNPKTIFLDRVYGIDNFISNIFIDFAVRNKMIYREQNAKMNYGIYYFDKKLNDYNYTCSRDFKMKVKLKNNIQSNYPYLDSFYIRDRLTGDLTNYINLICYMKY
jgi:hypothetical protein